MKALAPLLGLGLVSALAAQSPLTTLFAATHIGPTIGSLLYFDLTVNATITVNRIDMNSNAPVGNTGVLRFYQHVNPGQTFSGSEVNAANWTLLAETTVIAAGVNLPTIACFRNPVTLTAGAARGYIVELSGLQAAYTIGDGTNQLHSNAELTLSAGAAQNIGLFYPTGLPQGWVFGANNPRVFNGSFHYTLGATGTPCANNHVYGAGCGQKFASAYELIEDPANASAQMTGRSVTFIPDAFPAVTSYSVITNAGAIVDPTAHTPLAGFATTIAASPSPLDDGEVTVAVPGGNFPFPGGTTANLVVHTNGMVSVASNLTYLDTLGGDDWAPLVPALMAAPNALWCSWHDYDISATGAGQIKSFDSGTSLIITYEGVESYPTGAGNPSTLQFIFDYTNGQVSITWDSITATGNGGNGEEHLIGFSPGGANLTPTGEFDVTAVAATSTVDTLVEVLPLTLASSPRPIIGSNMTYTVTNVSAPASVGVLFLGLADLPGLSPIGLDLGFLGAPGCVLNFDLNGAFSTVIFPGVPFQLLTDNTYIGLEIFGQAAWLDAAANPFGFTTSNATYQLCEVN